jgi:hypothetical protein
MTLLLVCLARRCTHHHCCLTRVRPHNVNHRVGHHQHRCCTVIPLWRTTAEGHSPHYKFRLVLSRTDDAGPLEGLRVVYSFFKIRVSVVTVPRFLSLHCGALPPVGRSDRSAIKANNKHTVPLPSIIVCFGIQTRMKRGENTNCAWWSAFTSPAVLAVLCGQARLARELGVPGAWPPGSWTGWRCGRATVPCRAQSAPGASPSQEAPPPAPPPQRPLSKTPERLRAPCTQRELDHGKNK